ncbi:MAG: cytochrome P450 [Actinobacteria bacterium]|nr:cytochrome P450 [Actinomycetota bacterium]
MSSVTADRVVFDPYDYAIHDDPYPTYARLRSEAPVFHNPDVWFWALSRHADVMAALKDSETYSSANGVSLDPAAWGPNAHRTMSFLGMDPPRHGRMRRLVARGFTPRRVTELEPKIRSIAARWADRAVESDTIDFIDDFAGKFPMDVISEMMGVPEADRAQIRAWSDLLVHREPDTRDVPRSGMDAALHLAGYYADMIAERRRARTDDLTSALIDAEVDGDTLTDDEITGFLFLLVVAGNETTTKLLGNAWFWGWKFPDEGRKPFEDRTRIGDWIDETLRFDTSSQMLARTATRDVELHGVTIPAGERVLLLLGSANRDAATWDRPDTYDLDRTDTAQDLSSFGFGRHYCMGHALAVLEMRVAMEVLVDRIASYDVDETASERVHSVNVRGFAHLPTTITRR